LLFERSSILVVFVDSESGAGRSAIIGFNNVAVEIKDFARLQIDLVGHLADNKAIGSKGVWRKGLPGDGSDD